MALLFPKAKFIHMDRAPMDVFLSCFRNSIPGVPETANLKGRWQNIMLYEAASWPLALCFSRPAFDYQLSVARS